MFFTASLASIYHQKHPPYSTPVQLWQPKMSPEVENIPWGRGISFPHLTYPGDHSISVHSKLPFLFNSCIVFHDRDLHNLFTHPPPDGYLGYLPSFFYSRCCYQHLYICEVKVKVTQSCLTRWLMDCSLLRSSSMGFSRQEYWSG